MSWPDPPSGRTDPAYYHDATDPTEAQLRADFTRYYQLRQIGPYGETEAQQRQFAAQADELARRWGSHENSSHRSLWHQLQAAVSGWETQPEATRVAFSRVSQARAAGETAVADRVWRTLRQAAEITGHAEFEIGGSEQDGARWRPPEHGPARDREMTVLDRALGGRGPDLDPAQVATIIANTDRLLNDGRGAGAEERPELLPAHIALAPVDYSYDTEEAIEVRQIAALRQVQDLAAEHTNLVSGAEGWEGWTGAAEHDQAHLDRLEKLLDAARTARRDAALAGVPASDIEAVYRAGLEGTYWYQQPGDSHRGRIARLLEERDRAASAADSRHAPSADAAAAESGPDPGGRIDTAVEAALPATELPPDWLPPEAVDQIRTESVSPGADSGPAL